MVNNNDRWSALSLKDRADLMNMYITNGISDLKEMKKHYNSFGPGGRILSEKKNDEDKIVYKKQKWYNFGQKQIDKFFQEEIQPYVDSLGIDEVRRRLYMGLRPAGYPIDIKETKERFKFALENNVNENVIEERDDIWAEYLQIPENKRRSFSFRRRVLDSNYAPTIAKEKNNYKAMPLYPREKDKLVNAGLYLKHGENTLSGILADMFGPHTVGRGFDNKGDYVSYYDAWDLSPVKGDNSEDESRGLGKPVHFYDRIYLDNYYNIPEEFRGNPFITPAKVTAEKKANGGELITEEDQNLKKQKQTFIENIVDKINATPEGNAKLKDIAYSIGVRAKDRGKATIGNIISGTIAGLTGSNTQHDDNIAAFIYGPESQGFEKTKEKTFDYDKYIKDNYEEMDINKYKGVINNYGEYVIDKNQIDYIEKLINSNTPIYFDADLEYVEDVDNGNPDVRNSASIEMVSENEGRDDVKNYRISFRKDSKGNIVADATDLYDFENTSYSNKYTGSKSLQSRLINKVGKPYILSQSGIPVRFVDYETLRKADWMTLDSNQKRDLERAKLVNYFIEKSK